MAKLNHYRISAVSVEAAGTKLWGNNSRRKAGLVYNNGSESIFLIHTVNQSVSDGIPVVTTGSFDDDECNPQSELWAKCVTGPVDCRVIEVISKDAPT